MSVMSKIIRSGELSALTAAIASNKHNLNAIDDDGYTPLYLAAMKEATAPMVPHLIAAGVNVDLKGDDKETPLYIAAFNGLVDTVNRLLKGGANVNEVNGGDKETALHAAARYGHVEVVVALLAGGANINFRNTRLETPLFVAAKAT